MMHQSALTTPKTQLATFHNSVGERFEGVASMKDGAVSENRYQLQKYRKAVGLHVTSVLTKLFSGISADIKS